MIVLAILILTGLTLGYVFYPFFRRGQPTAVSADSGPLDELRSKRDTTYSMLKEIEFDHESGVLTDKDYQDMETRYRQKAINILKEMDQKSKDTNLVDEVEKKVRELRRGKARFCSQCGSGISPEDHFCSQCGQSLIKEGKKGD